jgi:Domain of unknown function (DUF1906)
MRLLKHTPVALTIAALAFTAMTPAQQSGPASAAPPASRNYVGFDANSYPGDDLLPALSKQFAFTGFWLTNPPGADRNPWVGKRGILLRNGFGFLVVANGRFDKEILASRKSGKSAAALAREDAATTVSAAQREGFPPRTILFLDQEEGGRMLPEQAEYLLAWTEAIARTAYRPGVYASGQPVPDGKGPDGKPATITTIQDLRQRVAAGHLHEIAFWVAQDTCPPAPGCVIQPNPAAPEVSGTLDSTAWQYAQSPRRNSITQACGPTYSRDGNCYATGAAHYQLDLNVSRSPDPSHGR